MDIDCVSPLYWIVGKCVKDLSGNGGPCAQTVDCYAPLVAPVLYRHAVEG